MLSSLVKEHASKQQHQREHVERLRKEALNAVAQLTSSTVDGLNATVSEAYYNQRKIDAESRALESKVGKFRLRTSQWLKSVESLRTSLRELGDVRSWSNAMQHDVNIVNDTLNQVVNDHSATDSADDAGTITTTDAATNNSTTHLEFIEEPPPSSPSTATNVSLSSNTSSSTANSDTISDAALPISGGASLQQPSSSSTSDSSDAVILPDERKHVNQ